MWSRKRRYSRYLDTHETFLDGENLPGFDTQQFEGVIEQPISKRSFNFVLFIFVLIGLTIGVQLLRLQIVQGSTLYAQSENNRLYEIPIFAERGIIFDRNGKELARNEVGDNNEPFSHRDYIDEAGFGHLLGYVGYPKEVDNIYWQDEIVGRFGVEKEYDEVLRGENGSKLIETDALQSQQLENTINPAEPGENIHLSIDAGIQYQLHLAMQQLAETQGYEGGAGIIMDIHTGELLALTNYPEFDPSIISEGEDTETIQKYFEESGPKPFLHRAVSGVYSPGSTIKIIIGAGALEEGVVTPHTKIYSSGSIEIPNPYNPDLTSIFKDWRYPDGHGETDIYHAIADSVNTYFYAVTGGYRSQNGMGIRGIEKYAKMFGIDQPVGSGLGTEPKGSIPSPEWKERIFDGEPWRLGDTYNTSIGQYGFQVTPLHMVRAVAAIANGGTLIMPTIVKNATPKEQGIVAIQPKFLSVMRDAMRETVTKGTAQTINISGTSIAAKTGTAQAGVRNSMIHSWSVGFFPYENPRYAFTVVMERGPNTEHIMSTTRGLRDFFLWTYEHRPEYFDPNIDSAAKTP